LANSCAYKVDQVCGRIKWVGHRPAGEDEAGLELSVGLGEQDGLRRRYGAVKLGQPCQLPLIGGRAESKRHAPSGCNRHVGPASAAPTPMLYSSSATATANPATSA
jgi:hypothetical protein